MGGKASRDKGARGELIVCKMLRDNLGGDYSRNLKQYQQSQEGDIGQLVGPYLLEVKNCKDLAIPAWWRQTVAAAQKVGAEPCLAYNAGAGRWKFVVPLSHGRGTSWGHELRYAQTLEPDGFYLIVREMGA